MRRVSTSLDVGSIFSAGFILSSIRPAVEAALGAFLCRVEPGKLLLKLDLGHRTEKPQDFRKSVYTR